MTRAGAARTFALALLVLPLASLSSALPNPVLPGTPPATSVYATPHEAAAFALERTRDASDHYVAAPPSSAFVTTQMLAALVFNVRADAFPSGATAARDQALRAWQAAEGAWHDADRFYDVTLSTQAICAQLETQSWALLASTHVANATQAAQVTQRADQLARSLRDLVQMGRTGSTPHCPSDGDPPPSQWPLALWAMMEYDRVFADAATRDAALAQLDSLIEEHHDAAFWDPTGPYLVATNAQYLLVLQAAARVSPSQYETARDDLAAFLTNHVLDLSAFDLVGQNLQRVEPGQAGPTLGPADAAAQFWLAYALQNQRRIAPATVGADRVPERIIQTLLLRQWSTQEGGFVNDAGVLSLTTNALAAMFTLSARVRNVASEAPRISVALPARTDFTYPDLQAADADQYFLSNEWTIRFSVETVDPGATERVLLPLRRLAPMAFNEAQTKYNPAPILYEGGTPTAAQTAGTHQPLLQFMTSGATNPNYRFVAYAPVVPTQSRFARDIQVFFENDADESVTMGSVTVELEASDIQIHGVSFNDVLLAPNQYDLLLVESGTDADAHLRLVVRDVAVVAHQRNELFLSYTDATLPVVGPITLTEDAAGQRPLATEDGRVRFARGQATFARAAVTDNAALQDVSLLVGSGLNQTRIPMTMDAATQGQWIARLPDLPTNDAVQLVVLAVDAQGNRRESPPLEAQVVSSLLREGNLVLLVFSLVLVVAGVVVYVRMGRRRK